MFKVKVTVMIQNIIECLSVFCATGNTVFATKVGALYNITNN